MLTGDYLSKNTGKRHEAHLHRFVSLLPSSIGTFAVPGNWDTDDKVFEGTQVHYLPGTDAEVRVRGARTRSRRSTWRAPAFRGNEAFSRLLGLAGARVCRAS